MCAGKGKLPEFIKQAVIKRRTESAAQKAAREEAEASAAAGSGAAPARASAGGKGGNSVRSDMEKVRRR